MHYPAVLSSTDYLVSYQSGVIIPKTLFGPGDEPELRIALSTPYIWHDMVRSWVSSCLHTELKTDAINKLVAEVRVPPDRWLEYWDQQHKDGNVDALTYKLLAMKKLRRCPHCDKVVGPKGLSRDPEGELACRKCLYYIPKHCSNCNEFKIGPSRRWEGHSGKTLCPQCVRMLRV